MPIESQQIIKLEECNVNLEMLSSSKFPNWSEIINTPKVKILIFKSRNQYLERLNKVLRSQ
jgi:hypothetical protein